MTAGGNAVLLSKEKAKSSMLRRKLKEQIAQGEEFAKQLNLARQDAANYKQAVTRLAEMGLKPDLWDILEEAARNDGEETERLLRDLRDILNGIIASGKVSIE